MFHFHLPITEKRLYAIPEITITTIIKEIAISKLENLLVDFLSANENETPEFK